jgi:hypothetical protein
MVARSRHPFRVLVALGLSALAISCGGEGLGDPTGSTCPTDSTLTYENFGQQFFSSHCLSCHSGKESPSLISVEAIRAEASEIDRAAAAGPDAVNTYMPEEGSVAEAERRQLGEWLACGAP